MPAAMVAWKPLVQPPVQGTLDSPYLQRSSAGAGVAEPDAPRPGSQSLANCWPDASVSDARSGMNVNTRMLNSAVTANNEQLVAEFNEMVSRWAADTQYTSSLSRIAQHPDYRRIISLGFQAVPLILRDLDGRGVVWFD